MLRHNALVGECKLFENDDQDKLFLFCKHRLLLLKGSSLLNEKKKKFFKQNKKQLHIIMLFM